MKSLRLLLIVTLLASPAALADRILPPGAQVGTLGTGSAGMIQFTPRPGSLLGRLAALLQPSGVYPSTPALRVYDTDNRLVLSGQLADYAGRSVAVAFDFQGNINRIWVLNSQELAALTQ